MINIESVTGILYRTIAPITGVTQPINNERVMMNMTKLVMIVLSLDDNFFLRIKAKTRNRYSKIDSIKTGYFSQLPGSKGKGLNKVLIRASGIFNII